MTTDDGIDVNKLTNDAFMAIDHLFGDDEDDSAAWDADGGPSEAKEAPLSDMDRMREFMLAMEWEYSEQEMLRFDSFLSDITPQYSDRYTQDTLKMMSSIVKYIMKAKSATVPETYYVLDTLAKTFSRIHKKELDESIVQREVRSVYQKVVALKNKISTNKRGVNDLDGQIDGIKSSDTNMARQKDSSEFPALSGDVLGSNALLNDLMKRLVICENKLAVMESQLEKQGIHSEVKDDTALVLKGLEERIVSLEKEKAFLSEPETVSPVDLHPTPLAEDDAPLSDTDTDTDFDLGLDDVDSFSDGETDHALQSPPVAHPDAILDGSDKGDLSEDGFGEVSPDDVSFDDLAFSDDSFEIEEDGYDENAAFDEISPDEMTFDDEILGDSTVDGSNEEVYLLEDGDIEYDELTMDDIYYETPEDDDSDDSGNLLAEESEEDPAVKESFGSTDSLGDDDVSISPEAEAVINDGDGAEGGIEPSPPEKTDENPKQDKIVS